MRRLPSIAVDIIIFHDNKKLILIKRGKDPYKDYFALPGGFVEYGETVENAALREAKEETNLDIKNLKLFSVYSDPKRDPRGHTISIVFYGEGIGNPNPGDDAKELFLFDLDNLPNNLAFDHNTILSDFIQRELNL
ncbi:MAG: ADP-ribose pyrophosphatase [Candidatus Methanofastidiosum methylothiophilum]|jgi:ADP-ribose pyrophosphatase YjhB (NUDIX family)|uniref:ADP-ribose pyrophosphatase n=1 Tax=Candidatus Methanofastidiosum methylothiophilum TaxID=1705564 RepID=A0A150IZ64_9EURY|nr:MAG: ADP-ribose pyrophosphatase [Candidatus Methanofastidiosum methylthiophilus]NMC76455.1 NUDIX hydrolase [Candidatus Methanofastidiosa archaeon]